jgi:hypothetical protein
MSKANNTPDTPAGDAAPCPSDFEGEIDPSTGTSHEGVSFEVLKTRIMDRLREALARIGDADAEVKITAMQATGLDSLFVDYLVRGRASRATCAAVLARIVADIRAGKLDPECVKTAILVFDECAQRLALVSDASHQFKYPSLGDPTRDLLIAFAQSLHR